MCAIICKKGIENCFIDKININQCRKLSKTHITSDMESELKTHIICECYPIYKGCYFLLKPLGVPNQ